MPAVSRQLPAYPLPPTGHADPRLRVLLRRLLQSVDPEVAAALPGAETPMDELLTWLRRRVDLEQAVVASLADLTSRTTRAVCRPPSGPPVLLEGSDPTGRFRLDLGGWGDVPEVRGRALQGLFPCTILYVNARAGDHQSPVAHGTLLGALLRLVAQVLGLALPIAMMLIIDKVVNQGARNTLVVLLLGVALLTTFQFLFQWVHALHIARRTELVAHPQRVGALRRVLGSEAAGELRMSVWESLQGALESGRYLTELRSQFQADLAFLLLLVLLMAAFDPLLLVVALAVLPLCVAVEGWSGRQARRSAEVVARLGQQLSTRYFELTAAAELVHVMNMSRHAAAQWCALDVQLALARHRLSLSRRLPSLAVEGLQKLSVLPVMLLGVSSVIDGAMTLGQYVAFNLLAMQLGQPVLRIAAWWRARDDQQLRRATVEQVDLRLAATAWPPAGQLSLPAADRWLLSVQHLRCAEGTARHPLSFELLGGGWLGITGPSGCGKSTLLRVLAGLRLPAQGVVLINGVPVHRLTAQERARFVQLVPQTPVVFSASIAENIGFGDPAADLQAILTAATVCGVADFAGRLPGHLNTLVGPAGRPLSGGEQQRVALARAVLARPRLLLLDEATAGLDGASEAQLLAQLRRFLPGTGVILVTHRAATLRGCAQVLDLAAGGSVAGTLRAVAH